MFVYVLCGSFPWCACMWVDRGEERHASVLWDSLGGRFPWYAKCGLTSIITSGRVNIVFRKQLFVSLKIWEIFSSWCYSGIYFVAVDQVTHSDVFVICVVGISWSLSDFRDVSIYLIPLMSRLIWFQWCLDLFDSSDARFIWFQWCLEAAVCNELINLYSAD